MICGLHLQSKDCKLWVAVTALAAITATTQRWPHRSEINCHQAVEPRWGWDCIYSCDTGPRADVGQIRYTPVVMPPHLPALCSTLQRDSQDIIGQLGDL